MGWIFGPRTEEQTEVATDTSLSVQNNGHSTDLEPNTNRSPLQRLIDERLPQGVEAIFGLLPIPDGVRKQIDEFMQAKEDPERLHTEVRDFVDRVTAILRADHEYGVGKQHIDPTQSIESVYRGGDGDGEVNASGDTIPGIPESV